MTTRKEEKRARVKKCSSKRKNSKNNCGSKNYRYLANIRNAKNV